MRYDAVVFDLDGTLINTLPDITRTVNSVVGQIGMAPFSENQIEPAVGSGVEILLRKLGVPEELNHPFSHQVSSMYAAMDSSEAVVYSGVREMLSEIILSGVYVCILSNKPEKGIHKTLSDHFADFTFHGIRGSSPGRPAKPSPEALLDMLCELEIPPEKALMVGDGESDALVSKAAGTGHLAVLWGFRNREILCDAGAVNFAETTFDILKFMGLQQKDFQVQR